MNPKEVWWELDDSWRELELPESWIKLKDLRPPKEKKVRQVTVDLDMMDARQLLSVLIDNGFPVEVSDNPIYREVDVRWIESEAGDRHVALAKDNERLKQELERLKDVYEGCDHANLKLFKENERLKQELAEARELSLF